MYLKASKQQTSSHPSGWLWMNFYSLRSDQKQISPRNKRTFSNIPFFFRNIVSSSFIERGKGKKAQSGSSAMSLQALIVVYLYGKVNDDFIVNIIFISSLLLQSVTRWQYKISNSCVMCFGLTHAIDYQFCLCCIHWLCFTCYIKIIFTV